MPNSLQYVCCPDVRFGARGDCDFGTDGGDPAPFDHNRLIVASRRTGAVDDAQMGERYDRRADRNKGLNRGTRRGR
jgi:hypothetical protein